MDGASGGELTGARYGSLDAGVNSRRLVAGLVVFCAFVFALDLMFPLGVGSAVPYVVAAMAALWLPRRRLRLFIAGLGTGLAVLGFFFPFPEPAVFWVGLQSRLTAVLAIWSTILLGNLLIRRTDELRDREARLRAILDAAVDAVITTDETGRIESCNSGAERMFGYGSGELIGREIGLIVPGLGLPGRAPAQIAEAAPPTSTAAGVLQGKRRDGSRFPANVALSEVLLDEPQRPAAVVAIIHDISELMAAQERAIQSERLAAIGQTIAALSHESRNELNTLKISTDILARLEPENPQIRAVIERLRGSQARLMRLLDDVRGFAAPVVLEPVECCLSDIWNRAWEDLAEPRTGRDAVLHEQSEAIDLTCLADEFRLEQVFRNLFENALAACEDPVRVEVRCAPAEIDGEPALAVTVRDNGPGIPEDIRKRLFEPFFTTKTHGTGLGMPISRRIIEAHGGTMHGGECRTGAEFQIVLPRQPASEARDTAIAPEGLELTV
jgi:PAS domain S-box-containing protein